MNDVLSVASSVGKVKMQDTFFGMLPFLLLEIAVLQVFIFFPSLVMVPPGWLK